MLYAATIIRYEPNKADTVKKAIAKYMNVEVFTSDDNAGKLVITIEFKNNNQLQELEDALFKVDGIIDVLHHAVNFEEETEKLAKGEITVDMNEFAKMRDDSKERK